MKSYPSIPTKIVPDLNFYFFDKLDGSNIRAEWNKKKGFYKFGSKTQLIDDSTFLGSSIKLIMDGPAEELSKRFTENKYESVVCFFEFYGEHSFAGSHRYTEPHRVTLIDIDVYKKGILLPNDFLKLTEGLDRANLLYTGEVTVEFVDAVKSGTLEGMTFEGVVGKGVLRNQQHMFKIKNRAWLEKLKEYCGDNVQLYERLK